MTDTLTLKNTVDALSEKLRETVNSIDEVVVNAPSDISSVYEMIEKAQGFFISSTTELHTLIYTVGNVVEDHIRSVYLFLDDATLEGHATELETQLGQLRLMGEAVKSLPNDYNDEMGDVIAKYFGIYNSVIDSQVSSAKLEGFSPASRYMTAKHVTGITKMFLLDSTFIKTLDNLKSFKESCVKILSILAMTLGRWETKLEDRVDSEHISEGMVMSNMERGKSMSSKKNKKKNKDTSFYN